MSKADAIEAARSRELDLVLIAAKSDPPVCKIVSYDKFRFNKEKKQKDLKKASKGQGAAAPARPRLRRSRHSPARRHHTAVDRHPLRRRRAQGAQALVQDRRPRLRGAGALGRQVPEPGEQGGAAACPPAARAPVRLRCVLSRAASAASQIKFSIQFRGREIMHSDVGLEVMNRMADKLEEVGVVDSQPKVMGRQMIMTVTPKQQQK